MMKLCDEVILAVLNIQCDMVDHKDGVMQGDLRVLNIQCDMVDHEIWSYAR